MILKMIKFEFLVMNVRNNQLFQLIFYCRHTVGSLNICFSLSVDFCWKNDLIDLINLIDRYKLINFLQHFNKTTVFRIPIFLKHAEK